MPKQFDKPDWASVEAAIADGWQLDTVPDPCGKTDYFIVSPDGVTRGRDTVSTHAYQKLVSQWEIWKSLGRPGAAE